MNNTPVTWDALNVILEALNRRLTDIETRLDALGTGPHILTAQDGSQALCGGPGVCWACIRVEELEKAFNEHRHGYRWELWSMA